jgi:uncharacterized protein YegP (UPF0339 family)
MARREPGQAAAAPGLRVIRHPRRSSPQEIDMAGTAPWFELSKTSDGQFRFALKADEKETLLASETYRSKSSAEGGIASVRSNCAQQGRYEKKVAANGRFFFNLKAGNGEVIGTSHMYPTAEARDAAIAAAMVAGASTTVREGA